MWLVTRESERTRPLSLRPGEAGVWDRRFRVTLAQEGLEDFDPDGFSVDSLGSANRAAL